LIRKGKFKQVVFAHSGLGGRKIKELKSGKHFDFLVSNYKDLASRFGKVDAILFHQGESETDAESIQTYYTNMEEFISNLEQNDILIPIYLSRASYCRRFNPEIIEVQDKLIQEIDRIKEGPNTDLLSDKKYRLPDECHFSLEGYDKMADLWVESLESLK
jgi:hypothetical protein